MSASLTCLRKQITHITSNVDNIQRQIIALFDKALNLDSDKKKSVSEKMAECEAGKITLEVYSQWLKVS